MFANNVGAAVPFLSLSLLLGSLFQWMAEITVTVVRCPDSWLKFSPENVVFTCVLLLGAENKMQPRAGLMYAF